MKLTQAQLAEHVVQKMSHYALTESAITGLILFYYTNPAKYKNDLRDEGFEGTDT